MVNECYGIGRLRPTNIIIMITECKSLHKFKLQFNDQYSTLELSSIKLTELYCHLMKIKTLHQNNC